MKRVLRAAGRGLARTTFVLAHLWCVGAVWFLTNGPRWWTIALALLLLVALPVAWYRWPSHRKQLWAVAGGAVLALFLLGLLKQPRTDRDWTPDMARVPIVHRAGDQVRIENVRDFLYRGEEDYDVVWLDQTYDARDLVSIDFLVERFHAWDALAHTLLSFGFRDGRRLVISVEVRREAGESFHPVAGIYRQFELQYVIGTERDLLGLRTNVRKSRAWLYPVRTTPERMRAVFLAMVARADALRQEPEFYNTLTSSCTTNIAWHVRELVPGRIPRDVRILLPGHAAALAHELDLIDTDLPLADAMAAYRIDVVAQEGPLDEHYSVRIRSRRPKR